MLLPLLDPLADKELPLDSKDALSEKPESLSGLSVLTPIIQSKVKIFQFNFNVCQSLGIGNQNSFLGSKMH